jgi:hypothetical protein
MYEVVDEFQVGDAFQLFMRNQLYCIILHHSASGYSPCKKPAWGIRPYRLERLNKKEKARKELIIYLVIYASASSTKTN